MEIEGIVTTSEEGGVTEAEIAGARFAMLGLGPRVVAAVVDQGYTVPTPIQEQAIPPVVAGRDVLGMAHTGTGKTAAFALPIIERLMAQPRNPQVRRRPVRALVVTPTRELAVQVGDSFKVYGERSGLKYTCIYGGVQQRFQVYSMQKGVDILVATPGRLLDLIGQGIVRLDAVQVLVLDEADRMLDMGFTPDIMKIAEMCPKPRQTLLFSATLPGDIVKLAGQLLSEPVELRIKPPKSTLALVKQGLYHVETAEKLPLLLHLLERKELSKVLVFTKMRVGADRLCDELRRSGVRAVAIHSDRTQQARSDALNGFKEGRYRILVATDVASRGLDIDEVTHVVNYELPSEDEAYVHRIGRTGRAASEGEALTFCASEERIKLRGIERHLGKAIPVVEEHPFRSQVPFARAGGPRRARGPQGGGGRPWGRESMGTGRDRSSGGPWGGAGRPAAGEGWTRSSGEASGERPSSEPRAAGEASFREPGADTGRTPWGEPSREGGASRRSEPGRVPRTPWGAEPGSGPRAPRRSEPGAGPRTPRRGEPGSGPRAPRRGEFGNGPRAPRRGEPGSGPRAPQRGEGGAGPRAGDSGGSRGGPRGGEPGMGPRRRGDGPYAPVKKHRPGKAGPGRTRSGRSGGGKGKKG